MKKFIMGLVVGICITLPASLYAAENVSKIEAYLNPEVKIEVDGEALELAKTPIIFESTTYLPIREVGEKIMGMTVGWDQESETVTMQSEQKMMTTESFGEEIWPVNDVSTVIEETIYEGLKAIVADGVTYFSPTDYNRTYRDAKVFKVSNNTIDITKYDGTSVTIVISNINDVYMHNRQTYINVSHFPGIPDDKEPAPEVIGEALEITNPTP